MTKDEFIRRAEEIHGNQYEYVDLPQKVTTTMCINIKCKYHDYVYSTGVSAHIHARTGCRLCYNDKVSKRLTKDTAWFMAEAKKKHKGKYTYEHARYVGTKQAVIITCAIHGTFNQSPNNHLSGYGCPECAQDVRRQTTITTDQFIERARQKHGDIYDYSATAYDRYKEKVTIICKKHGPFLQQAASHMNGCGCPTCKSSKGELAVLQYLIQHNIPYEYQKHTCHNNTNLWFDFIIDGNIVVEIDGIQHRKMNSYFHKTEDDFLLQQLHDSTKAQICISNNWCLHRIEYNGKDIKKVVNTLHQILQGYA